VVWITRHWQRTTVISALLLPVSWIYCALVGLRYRLYRIGIIPSHRLSVPVVVVGNITVGGTGKTPMVIWLAQYLLKKGYHPGIVSRGYRGSLRVWPQKVTANSDPVVVGDEPVLLARHSGCPVVVDPNRVRGAKHLIESFQCSIIVSDDGMQHYALSRDIEIAIIDGDRRFGNGHCLPAGPLREPVTRLQRAHLSLINGRAGTKEYAMTLRATGFCRLNEDVIEDVDNGFFEGKSVHAVAGIGNPARFFTQLRSMGIEVLEHPYADHHNYQPEDLQFNDNRPVIMTEKDAVKCRQFQSLLEQAPDRYWYLSVEAVPDNAIEELILNLLPETPTRG